MPGTWSARFPGYAAKFGRDFAASLLKPTGKVDAEGNALAVWQDYHFEEMEAGQFDGIDEVDRIFCHGLFGDEDAIGLP